MSEEEDEPTCCPRCDDTDTDYVGKTTAGYHLLKCRECGQTWAIKNVTGLVKITVEVQE